MTQMQYSAQDCWEVLLFPLVEKHYAGHYALGISGRVLRLYLLVHPLSLTVGWHPEDRLVWLPARHSTPTRARVNWDPLSETTSPSWDSCRYCPMKVKDVFEKKLGSLLQMGAWTGAQSQPSWRTDPQWSG